MNHQAAATVHVLVFGALRDRIQPCDVRCASGATVRDVWRSAGGAPDVDLPSLRVARNQQFCAWETVVQDDDEVAFMPPVSGG